MMTLTDEEKAAVRSRLRQWGPKADHSERNASIAREYASGVKVKELGRIHGLTRQSVLRCIQKALGGK